MSTNLENEKKCNVNTLYFGETAQETSRRCMRRKFELDQKRCFQVRTGTSKSGELHVCCLHSVGAEMPDELVVVKSPISIVIEKPDEICNFF
jgi:hypothetical protein